LNVVVAFDGSFWAVVLRPDILKYMTLPANNNDARDRNSCVWYGDQDANGVDLSLIHENLKLTPSERLLRGDRARRSALRLLEYGRQQRARDAGRK